MSQSQTTSYPVHLRTLIATDEPIPATGVPDWKSRKQFRNGVFVGATTILFPILLWVIFRG